MSVSNAPTYMPGFGNDFETESLPGALPQGRNSPQRCNYGLYAEQLSGSPFTAPRGTNERSWLYRIRPGVRHSGRYSEIELPNWKTGPHIIKHGLALGQLRWSPTPMPEKPTSFIQGVNTMTTAGDALSQSGMAAHVYAFNENMEETTVSVIDLTVIFVVQTLLFPLLFLYGVIQAFKWAGRALKSAALH